jgi:hypothetical protein
MGKAFLDVCYITTQMLKVSDRQLGEVAHPEEHNQAGERYKRLGPKRMRALELLK